MLQDLAFGKLENEFRRYEPAEAKAPEDIKWNFTKFLIDRNGEIVARFEPTDMKSLRAAIEKCLQA